MNGWLKTMTATTGIAMLVGCGGGPSVSCDLTGDVSTHISGGGGGAQPYTVTVASGEWTVSIVSPMDSFNAGTFDVAAGFGDFSIAHSIDDMHVDSFGLDGGGTCHVTFDSPGSASTSGSFSCTGLTDSAGHTIDVENGSFTAPFETQGASSGGGNGNSDDDVGIFWLCAWLEC